MSGEIGREGILEVHKRSGRLGRLGIWTVISGVLLVASVVRCDQCGEKILTLNLTF